MSGLATLLLLGALATTPLDESVGAATGELVEALLAEHPESAVMLGRIDGHLAQPSRHALQLALLSRGVGLSLGEKEAKALRAQYRARSEDVYDDPKFQKLLRARSGAKLTLNLISHCDPPAEERRCRLTLEALLPTQKVFGAERQLTLTAPSQRSRVRNFLLLLLAYALLPVLLHRIDLAARLSDGRWRHPALIPVYALGNRVSTAVLLASFFWVAPEAFARWLFPLPDALSATAALWGWTAAGLLWLHFAGCFVISLWRDSAHGQSFAGTFAELFVLHPAFWTREHESRLGRDGAPPALVFAALLVLLAGASYGAWWLWEQAPAAVQGELREVARQAAD